MGGDAADVAGELDVGDMVEEGAHDVTQLQPRDQGAEAEMIAGAEADMLGGRAADVELIGALDRLRIAVGGAIPQYDPVARADGFAGKLGVSRCGAQNVGDGAYPADEFVGQRGEQCSVVAQAFELTGVFDQFEHAAGERVSGGFLTGGDEHESVIANLVIGEGHAINLGFGEDGDEVITAATTAFFREVLHVGDDGAQGVGARLQCIGGAIIVIRRGASHVGHLEEHRPVFPWQLHDFEDDCGGKFGGDVGDEIAFAGLDEIADQGGGKIADEAVHPGDGVRKEAMMQNAAHLVVARRIVGGEHRTFHGEPDAGRTGRVREGCRKRQGCAGFLRTEKHRIGIDGADIRQTGNRPITATVAGLGPVHWVFRAQTAPKGVRIAGGEEFRIGEVKILAGKCWFDEHL